MLWRRALLRRRGDARRSRRFLRTTLAGDLGFDHYLTPGWALTREPLAEVFETEKRSPNAAQDECLAYDCPDPQFFLYFPHQPGSEQARAERDPAAALPAEPDDCASALAQ